MILGLLYYVAAVQLGDEYGIGRSGWVRTLLIKYDMYDRRVKNEKEMVRSRA